MSFLQLPFSPVLAGLRPNPRRQITLMAFTPYFYSPPFEFKKVLQHKILLPFDVVGEFLLPTLLIFVLLLLKQGKLELFKGDKVEGLGFILFFDDLFFNFDEADNVLLWG